MSHIVKNKEDLQKLQEVFSYISKNQITEELIVYILESLIPRDNNNQLETYYYLKNTDKTGQFIAKYNTIVLSIQYLSNWIKDNKEELEKTFNIKKKNNLDKYLTLYPIIHEIEHAYQYLMGTNIEPAPNNLVKEAYKELFELLNPSHRKRKNLLFNIQRQKSLNLYYSNSYSYCLERNANYETTTLLTELALNNNDIVPSKVFRSLTYNLIRYGYEEDELGCIYHTFKGIKQLKKFKKIENDKELSFLENIRYGLPITKEERKKLLTK